MDKAKEPSVTDQIGQATIAGATYPLLRGLAVTIAGIDADRTTAYGVQKAWYEAQGLAEPARVRARREAWAADAGRAGSTPAGQGSAAVAPLRGSTPRAPSNGPKAADLIRKSLAEGADTATIVATVKAFNPDARVDARTVAYYRHRLRKDGKLPPRGA